MLFPFLLFKDTKITINACDVHVTFPSFYSSQLTIILQFFLFLLVSSDNLLIFAAMFEKEIEEYERVRKDYQQKIADKMGHKQWMEYNEILFSAYSCAIEGNSFTVDDTRILREQGMAMIPVGKSLLECTEMADHFRAFDYMVSHLEHPFDGAPAFKLHTASSQPPITHYKT